MHINYHDILKTIAIGKYGQNTVIVSYHQSPITHWHVKLRLADGSTREMYIVLPSQEQIMELRKDFPFLSTNDIISALLIAGVA